MLLAARESRAFEQNTLWRDGKDWIYSFAAFSASIVWVWKDGQSLLRCSLCFILISLLVELKILDVAHPPLTKSMDFPQTEDNECWN